VTVDGSLLADAFAHHVWATTRVIDACVPLDDDQLATEVIGTRGPILQTLRHLVGSDAWYLRTLVADPPVIDEDRMGLAELRDAIVANGSVWAAVLWSDVDPDRSLLEVDEGDGYEKRATMGIRLAQALHHGTDHRSQICTTLTSLGIEPPPIDVWDFGITNGHVAETWSTPG
jgi:uncharacterized damage-inducible protein DinB